MTELTDQELRRIRLRFIDLIKSFFVKEPDAEHMSRWRGIMSALTSEHINPAMDTAIQQINRALTEIDLSDIQDEYYQLFTNPFSDHLLKTSLSQYVDGHGFGRSLVEFRGFLTEAGIARNKNIPESEDSLIIMLDVLKTLVQDEVDNPGESRRLQSKLLKRYLGPLASYFIKDLEQNKSAAFYRTCGLFLTGYLDMEQGLMITL